MPPRAQVQCPECGKAMQSASLREHHRMFHSAPVPPTLARAEVLKAGLHHSVSALAMNLDATNQHRSIRADVAGFVADAAAGRSFGFLSEARSWHRFPPASRVVAPWCAAAGADPDSCFESTRNNFYNTRDYYTFFWDSAAWDLASPVSEGLGVAAVVLRHRARDCRIALIGAHLPTRKTAALEMAVADCAQYYERFSSGGREADANDGVVLLGDLNASPADLGACAAAAPFAPGLLYDDTWATTICGGRRDNAASGLDCGRIEMWETSLTHRPIAQYFEVDALVDPDRRPPDAFSGSPTVGPTTPRCLETLGEPVHAAERTEGTVEAVAPKVGESCSTASASSSPQISPRTSPQTSPQPSLPSPPSLPPCPSECSLPPSSPSPLLTPERSSPAASPSTVPSPAGRSVPTSPTSPTSPGTPLRCPYCQTTTTRRNHPFRSPGSLSNHKGHCDANPNSRSSRTSRCLSSPSASAAPSASASPTASASSPEVSSPASAPDAGLCCPHCSSACFPTKRSLGSHKGQCPKNPKARQNA